MNTITVRSPVDVAVPRAVRWVALATHSLLARLTQQRAERAAAQARSELELEAAAVRAYARRYASHDPRFAADLLAAADRHETI